MQFCPFRDAVRRAIIHISAPENARIRSSGGYMKRFFGDQTRCPGPSTSIFASTKSSGSAWRWRASERDTTANRLLSELAAQWLENHEWPRTDAQIQTARASLFAAQAIARDMIAAGREDEIEEIRQFISTIVRDPPVNTPAISDPDTAHRDTDDDDS